MVLCLARGDATLISRSRRSPVARHLVLAQARAHDAFASVLAMAVARGRWSGVALGAGHVAFVSLVSRRRHPIRNRRNRGSAEKDLLQPALWIPLLAAVAPSPAFLGSWLGIIAT